MKTVHKLLANNVVDIIKPGTTIEVLSTGVKAQIKLAIVYPDGGIMYEIHNYTENGQVYLGAIYPNNIKNHDKLVSQAVNIHNTDTNMVDDSSSDSLNTIKELLLRLSVDGMLYSDASVVMSDESYTKASTRYDSTTTSSYGYIGGSVVLPNDTYIKVSVLTNIDTYEITDYITRIVELKPFYKRWFNTLKFGRSHPDNFTYIESNDDYMTRIIIHMTSSIKARGYILYNKSSVRL